MKLIHRNDLEILHLGYIGHMKAILQIVSLCVYAFTKQLNRVQGFLETNRHI